MKRMRVCIRSTSIHGKIAYALIKNNFNMEIISFMEDVNYLRKRVDDGIPVMSQYQVWGRYKKREVDKIIVPGSLNVYTLLTIKKELESMGFLPEDIIVIPVRFMDSQRILTEDEKRELLLHHEFNYLKYLEFHVADHCNLKCDNCSHFSQYVEKKEYMDIEQLEKDLQRVAELVDNIQTIRLLGGECLLNSELYKYINLTKKIFPYSETYIVTNGLLIRSMSSILVESIKKNNVEIAISSYKPIWNKIDEIVDFLELNHIKFKITEPFAKFYKIFDLEKKIVFPYKTLEDLPSCMCKNLYYGKMTICPTVCYTKYYDENNKEIKIGSLCKEGIVDIYEVKTFNELSEKLETPCEFCDYCTMYRASRDTDLQCDWKQSKEIK